MFRLLFVRKLAPKHTISGRSNNYKNGKQNHYLHLDPFLVVVAILFFLMLYDHNVTFKNTINFTIEYQIGNEIICVRNQFFTQNRGVLSYS